MGDAVTRQASDVTGGRVGFLDEEALMERMMRSLLSRRLK